MLRRESGLASAVPIQEYGWVSALARLVLLSSSQSTEVVVAFGCGICSSGIGCALNKRWHGLANHLAMVVARLLRALSVAIPVFAYICRYNFEMKISASRALNEDAQLDRFQTEPKL